MAVTRERFIRRSITLWLLPPAVVAIVACVVDAFFRARESTETVPGRVAVCHDLSMHSAVRTAVGVDLVITATAVVTSQQSTAGYPTACVLPLREYCKGECLTYEAQLAKWDVWVGVQPPRAERATCGKWRTLRMVYEFTGEDTLYFDYAGQLVGVATSRHTIDSVCKGRFAYGQVPKCVAAPTPPGAISN